MIFVHFIVLIFHAGYAILLQDAFVYWTHRKGYRTLGLRLLVTLPLWLGLSASMVLWLRYLFGSMDGTIDPSTSGYLGLFLLMFVLIAVGTGGSFLLLRLLPKRRIRMAGTRSSRIPYAGIGYAVVTLTVIVSIIILVFQTSGFITAISAVISAIGFSGMMSYLARRAKTPTVEEAISKDPRPPLLYLRSFDQELQRFAEVSREEAAKYSEITSLYEGSAYYLTLEQFFTREVQNAIGPLIALGNPTDSLPPEGAARTYAADGGWQQYFIDLSNRSAAILMQMGNTDNLNWELGSILGRGLHTKLFIVTPPASNVGKFWIMGRFIQLSNRIKGLQLASWHRFAAILEKAGYIPPAEDPGPGAVVTFDEHSRAMTIITGAKTPTEYVGAISMRLENSAEQRTEGNPQH